jgi:prepilin-type N-terminal cleavage/methylation domain-containing protein
MKPKDFDFTPLETGDGRVTQRSVSAHQTFHQHKRSPSLMGFTLIELLVVISIISLLSSVVFASLSDAREKARYAANQQMDGSFNRALAQGLVGEWLFDGDTLVDSSGNNNNGSGVNSPTFSGETPFGNGSSLNLNGSNQYVSLPALVPSSGVCNMTLSAWSYNKGLSGYGGGVIAGSSVGNGYANIEYGDTQLRFELRNAGTGNSRLINGDFKDKWIFTVLTLENGKTRGYVNGELVWTGSDIGCIGLGMWRIGRWDTYFNGYIDSIRVYESALSASEIQKLYAEGLANNPKFAQQ